MRALLTAIYNSDLKDKETATMPQLKFELTGKELKCYFTPVVTYEQNEQGEQEIANPAPEGSINYNVISELGSYRSYAMVRRSDYFGIKIGRQYYTSTCEIIDLNRLGVANKEDFGKLVSYLGFNLIAQIDTGMVSDTEKDIVINVLQANADNITLVADCDTEKKAKTELNGKYPRETLWDNYSLTVNGVEYKADRWGNLITRNSLANITCEDGKDYIEFTIKKYKGYFTDTVLNRDIDNEEVFIENSAGFCNPRRLKLLNGSATFRLYPFDYKGYVKIKLGRKWYSVWNDYTFTIV